jgi:hypothetical protein
MSRIWDAIKQARRQRLENAGSGNESRLARPERRAAVRRAHRADVLIYGLHADRQPFHEQVPTIDDTERGCLLVSETTVTPGQRLFLTNTGNQAEQECRVVHVSERVHGKIRVGIAFPVAASHFWNPAETR